MPINIPAKQHYLPRTYLKRFVIDANNPSLESFIYCAWEAPHSRKTIIARVAINSDKFIERDFYTVANDNEPYKYESFFRDSIEPLYNDIMNEVQNEQNLSLECRDNFVLWLFFNKYRNIATRKILRGLVKFMIESQFFFNNSTEKKDFLRNDAPEFISKNAKEMQLKFLSGINLLTQFYAGMGTKRWEILKTDSSDIFLTNDNPGFSINFAPNPKIETLNSSYATNDNASNYFILSPKYCLHIIPYYGDDPAEINLSNQEIEYKIVDNKYIRLINTCTALTKSKYLISNNKNLLEEYAKFLSI